MLFFSKTERSVLMALVFYYRERYNRKSNNAKNPTISNFSFGTKRTQLNAAHAQLLQRLRPTALTETCWFITIQSLEFPNICQNNSSLTTWIIYHPKSEFWHEEFSIIQNLQWKRFPATNENRLSKIYLNSVDRRDLVSICSKQMMKNNVTSDFVFFK